MTAQPNTQLIPIIASDAKAGDAVFEHIVETDEMARIGTVVKTVPDTETTVTLCFTPNCDDGALYGNGEIVWVYRAL